MRELTLIAKNIDIVNGVMLHLYKCYCGNEFKCRPGHIKSGNTKSCGCYNKQLITERNKSEKFKTNNTKHGHHTNGKASRTYVSWRTMIQRVTNPKSPIYFKYGGRGIKVCEYWLDFTSFLASMGERPLGTSLDRIDNNGNYEPSNCKWSTPKEQAANRRPPPKRGKLCGF